MNNDTFQWTDELVESLIWDEYGDAAVRFKVEQFKKSKMPKKEWEIVSFIDSGDRVLQKGNDGRFIGRNAIWGATEENLLKSASIKIHSVRRLSDNEVFTVGDEVITNQGRGRHKIVGFKICDGDMCADLPTFPCQYEFLKSISHIAEQPKRERIEVKKVFETYQYRGFHYSKSNEAPKQITEEFNFGFTATADVPKEKFPAIKAAIERVLNDDSGDCRVHEATLRAIKEAEENAFYAARKSDGPRATGNSQFWKHQTFQDYINHQRDKK